MAPLFAVVSAGAGVSLVPRGIYEQYRQGAGWTGYEFPELTGIDNLFYWHENAGRHPAREAFLTMLQTEFEGSCSSLPCGRELAPAGLRSSPNTRLITEDPNISRSQLWK